MDTTELLRIFIGPQQLQSQNNIFVRTVAAAVACLTACLAGLRFAFDGPNSTVGWLLASASALFAVSYGLTRVPRYTKMGATMIPLIGFVVTLVMPFLELGLRSEAFYWLPLVPTASLFLAPWVSARLLVFASLSAIALLAYLELPNGSLQEIGLRAGAIGGAVVFGALLASKQQARSRSEKRQLWQEAAHHPLTGLKNRHFFVEMLRMFVERSHRDDDFRLTLLFLDLDGLKGTNDTYGHAAGDALICEAANRLKAAVRANDIPCHIAGDEFTAILDGCGSSEARKVAQRICDEVQQPISFQGTELRGSFSIGIAFYAAGETAEDLIRRADRAMYRAKQSGGNRAVVDGTVDTIAALS